MVDKQKILRDWLQETVIEEGLVSVYKPYGAPSTALTDMYKRVTGQKVGHGGTLDPLAEGAMLLGIGKGTKLLTKYLTSEKRYRATMLFGAQSYSGDLELPLEILPIPSSTKVSEAEIEKVLSNLTAGFVQTLPLLSAVKHKGKASYELARSGKAVEARNVDTRILEYHIATFKELSIDACKNLLEETGIELQQAFLQFIAVGEQVGYNAQKYSFMMEKWKQSLKDSKMSLENVTQGSFYVLELEVLVPKGMYIRSLVTDIAKRIRTVGVLVRLVRSRYS